jgi:CHAT domain-containing protein/tetratricopeptide (TPR) repeat protein
LLPADESLQARLVDSASANKLPQKPVKGEPLAISSYAAHVSCALPSPAPTRSCVLRCLAGVFLLIAVSLLAAGQQARWSQLNQQVLQLDQQGKYADATPLAQEAVRTAESSFGPEHPNVGLSLIELGRLLADQGKFADAEAAYRRALGIFEKAYGENNDKVALTLNNIGDLYNAEGRYPDAEKFFQQSLSIVEKALGPNNVTVGFAAGNLAAVYSSEGKYADAEQLYKRAIAIGAAAQGPDSSGQAAYYINLGQLYDKLGKFADAEQLTLRAVSIELKTYGNNHPETASDIANLAVVYVDEGKFSDAESTYQKALTIDQNALGPNSSAAAWILDGLGGLYRREGRYAEAEPIFQRSLAIREKALGPNHPDVAEVLISLGGLYEDEGKYADAESFYRRAINIQVKALGPGHPMVGLSVTYLASLYVEMGRLSDAEAMYRVAMNIDLKSVGRENPQVAVVLHDAAAVLEREEKLPDAESLARGAMAIDEKVYGPDHPVYSIDLQELAHIYLLEKKPVDAEPLFRRSNAIAEKTFGPNHPEVAGNLNGLAAAYQQEGKYLDAEPLFKQALGIYEGIFGPDHPNTGELEMNLAVLYYAWNRPELAEPIFDERNANLMNQFRSNATYMSEKDRLTFLGTVSDAFPKYFSFALKYHDADPALAGKVYDILLEEKGFIAASAAALRAKILASGDQQTLALFDKLTAEKTQLAGLVSATQGDPAERRKQVVQLERETDALEQEIAKRSAGLSEQKTLSVVTWRDVQKTLKPGDAAVEIARFPFYDGKDFTGTNDYIALVVTPESKNPNFIFLGESQKLESSPIADYRANVGQTRGLTAEPAPGEAAPGAGNTRAAYEAFWKPLEPAIGNAKRIYVSPDGVLNTIPIGLLADSSGKLLLDKYQLRYVNSTKDLLSPTHPASLRAAVLLGNPKFDLTEADQRAALAGLNGNSVQHADPTAHADPAPQSGKRSVDLSGAALNPLPGTQLEVNAVSKLLKDSAWQPTSYTGDDALKSVVVTLRSPRVLHIATHGFFLSDQDLAQQSKASGGQQAPVEDPMLRSGLFFAGADRIRSGAAPVAGLDDGVLTAYEASQLNLEGTELVVLSACETGLGQQSNSEGVFGLRRGLQEAGADAVMMSMWSVPDRETQELISLFYAKWLGGLDKAEALRQAQLQERETVRQRYGKDLPYYWGAFVLVGR